MSLYQQILGTPFVYNHVRPLIVGGIDWAPFYERVQATGDDVILDVGCGTGIALAYLKAFAKYEGLDTDEVAIEFARKNYGTRANVSFRRQMCTRSDVTALQPSRVLLCGLLHHISDEQVIELFAVLKESSKLRRIVTSDIVFLEGKLFNNLMAHLDRGTFCRRRPEYEALVARAGLRVVESALVRSHPVTGLVKYLMMTIEP